MVGYISIECHQNNRVDFVKYALSCFNTDIYLK